MLTGKITAIVGPNGAGKSTLLKALSGTLRVSRGEVYVRGRKTTNTAPEKLVRHGLGYVPQVSNVFPDLTVRENLEMGAYTRHRGTHARISELCELFPTSVPHFAAGPRCSAAVSAPCSPWPGRSCSNQPCCCSMSRVPDWPPRCREPSGSR